MFGSAVVLPSQPFFAENNLKLEKPPDIDDAVFMNAAEIIQEIARLPEAEQGKVVEFVEGLKGTKQVRYLDSLVVEETAEKVFREHAPLFEKLAQ